jgi:hypothetical protein
MDEFKPPGGRRFIWQRLDSIEDSILNLKRGLELMAIETIERATDKALLEYQVAGLSEAVHDLRGEVDRQGARLEALEKHNSLVRWIVRQAGTILLVVLISYIISRLL